ncbi:potassium channel subfamily K member 6 [Halyomorpha halys]|uniref:potassium channel subfamily K member 6 n=1 Tax=Halyomorpha halys TaxID=286706 RepID=UPI0006D4FBD5|nr:potassium channel subfamily K member 6-like isoform X2 [Halyomorpha halys]
MLRSRAHTRRLFGFRRSTFFLVLFGLSYVCYLLAGALVFAAIEAPGDAKRREQLHVRIQAFRNKFVCVDDSALEDLIQEVVKASNRGVSAANNVSGEPNWSFGQSLFFSSTIVTTIGYGNVTPLSREGKMFCIVYAMIGIPLTLVLLSALVDRLMMFSTAFLQYLNSRLGHLYQPFNIRVLHLMAVGSILVIFCIMIPASIFAAIEPEWDFLDSLYYCFISLTTVGLGDYIPGDFPNQPYRPFYKILTTVYLLVGLTFMMLLLTIYYEIPELNLGILFLMRSDERTGDPEKMRLSAPATTKYTEEESKETPSPEDITPVHARP